MRSEQNSNSKVRDRILVIAHCFDADYSMESRLSWLRAENAAKRCATTVICVEPYAELPFNLHSQVSNLNVVTVAHTAFEKLLINTPFGFYLAYRLWHLRVLEVARKLHAAEPFSLIHQVSYCGYREPGCGWMLGVPFVWGPIGGTQNVPWQFLRSLDFFGALKEGWRSIANSFQLKYGMRVGQALRAAKAVYVANRQARDSFKRARGVELPCQLETGLEHIDTEPRALKDTNRPLQVLWSGRLECWKGLPLLLKAVAKLPADVSVELRILGSGSRETRYKKMAERLRISDRIEWVPLPHYSLRDEHYQWADLFAFTSLRDTSGTGLLESLAAGVPILGVDHQGARDIMSSTCAVRVPVRHPRQVVRDLSQGILTVANDPKLLMRLSEGALKRAHRYHWSELNAEITECYGRLLGDASTVGDEGLADPAVELSPKSGISVNVH